jgi:hypothetical protein
MTIKKSICRNLFEVKFISLQTNKLFVIQALIIAGISIAANTKTPPRIYPTGVTIYSPSQAYNSYVSFSAMDGKTHLIDMNGNEVHQWQYPGVPGQIIDPKLIGGKRGHVLVQLSGNGDKRGGIFGNKTVGELDWDGNTVWEWGTQAPGGSARQNHDWARLTNGNTLLLVAIPNHVPTLSKYEIGDQGIYEITPDGKIIWQWVASEHLPEFGFSDDGLKYLRNLLARDGGSDWGYLEINDMKPLGPNHWFDAGDKRFNPNNIIIDSRKGNFIVIIDKVTGKVVWKLGPYFPGSDDAPDHRLLNKTLPRPIDQLSGQHDAQIIPEGLPGAGDLLVFDDQGGAGFPAASLGIYAGSRVLEINPTTNQIVWQYTGENSARPVWSFFSSFISSARRLPNGNTLIDEGMNGRFFQVTPTGTIVWEYLNPYFNTPAASSDNQQINALVYRAIPIPYNWVPEGTPHQEDSVIAVDITTYHVPVFHKEK